MDRPLVSVCIPIFNGESLMRRALDSVVRQTYKNLEVVVVDDVSTDNTRNIALDYAAKDRRVKYFSNEKNIGCSGNYLRSIQLASGHFVQWLAHDDWLDINHIAEKISIFQRYPDIALVFSRVETYRLDGNQQLVLVEKIHKRPGLYSSSYAINSFYKQPGLFGCFCMARKKDIVEEHLTDIPNKYGYNSYYKFMSGDTLTPLSILSRYPYMYYTDKVCYNVLHHAANTSKTCWPATMNNISELTKFLHINRVGLEYFFKNRAKDQLFNYRVFSGSELLVTVLRDLARLGAKTFSFKQLSLFFDGYSFAEKLATAAYVLPHGIKRVLDWGVRKSQKIRTIN